MKKCKECNEVKDLSEFNKDKYSKDGYTSKCKKCRTNRYKLKCEYCGNDFKGSHKTQKFCSVECRGKSITGERNPLYKNATIKFKCDTCGKECSDYKSHYDRTVNHFCSSECFYNYNHQDNHHLWKGGLVTSICDYCGKEYLVKPTDLKGKENHYCSTICMGKHRTYLNLGENNPNWNGGTSATYNKLSSFLKNSTISKWREDSIAYNDGKCVITGQPYDCVHHLISHNTIVKTVMEELKLEVKDMTEYTCEQLLAMKEKCLEVHYRFGLGVCLTNEVHEDFHKQYGFGNNTPEQFEEFKNKYINNKSA